MLQTEPRGINIAFNSLIPELTVSDVEGLYDRILTAGIKPFREMKISRYPAAKRISSRKNSWYRIPMVIFYGLQTEFPQIYSCFLSNYAL